MKVSSILGLNARSALFSYPYNTSRGKKIARSKLLTKRVFKKAGIPTPDLYAKFSTPSAIVKYDWNKLPDAFALKPNKGYGGEGIIVVKKRGNEPNTWITVRRQKVSLDDLKLHAFDILEGAYSVDSSPDTAYIEEYVGRHKALRKYSYRGTPDIRVIVFNKVPVMAMLRLPTKESGGRANLHQGAVGVGVDIATGITTRAIWHGEQIIYKPGTKRKLHGIKIPMWEAILELAAKSEPPSYLGYLGVDVVLHPEKGPMVLEINSQPGLQIQLANHAGLKKRLERVDELEVRSPEHGVKIAKALFSAKFADRVKNKEKVSTLKIFEEVKVVGADNKKHIVRAKVDTGAYRTSIDKELAEKLGLLSKSNILWERQFKSALGTQSRTVIGLKYYLAGTKINTVASVTNRHELRVKFIIGRKDLGGFTVATKGSKR
jgi:alpha-L-glutamate ligase-like protein